MCKNAVISAQSPYERAKRCYLAVKALCWVPVSPPARYPHLMRGFGEGRGRGMKKTAKGVADRVWQWISMYGAILGAGAHPDDSPEDIFHLD